MKVTTCIYCNLELPEPENTDLKTLFDVHQEHMKEDINMTQDWKSEFVKELSHKIKHFCCGQYEEHSVEMDAFQSGVSTAIGMMSIDLLGGVKSKGMLEMYTERLLKEERNAVLEEIEREVGKKPVAYFLAGEAFIRSQDIEDSINNLRVK